MASHVSPAMNMRIFSNIIFLTVKDNLSFVVELSKTVQYFSSNELKFM